MQGPLHYADAMAEATTYWSKVWTEQDPTPCGYVDVGLTECQPDSMCAELVQRIVHLKGADGIERDRSLQTAVVSSMCWLHTAAKSRYDGFTLTLNSWRYKGLVQALAMIRMPLQASALHMLLHMLHLEANMSMHDKGTHHAVVMQSKLPTVRPVMLHSCVSAD